MKIRLALSVAAMLMSAVVLAGDDEMPTQKPGLWQVTMTNAKNGSRSFKMCQDAASVAAGEGKCRCATKELQQEQPAQGGQYLDCRQRVHDVWHARSQP